MGFPETDSEQDTLRLARDASVVPNAKTPAHFVELRNHFGEDEIVEIVAMIALFGWLNRWSDTMATELEREPMEFASRYLTQRGCKVGKHAAAS